MGDRVLLLGLFGCVWLAAMAVAMVVRFTLFAGADGERLFGLAMVYAVGTWLPVMSANMVEGRRLTGYLREHHPRKLAELAGVAGWTFGRTNGFRLMPWLYSDDDLGDPVLARMKQERRKFFTWLLVVLLSYAVVMPVLLGV